MVATVIINSALLRAVFIDFGLSVLKTKLKDDSVKDWLIYRNVMVIVFPYNKVEAVFLALSDPQVAFTLFIDGN